MDEDLDPLIDEMDRMAKEDAIPARYRTEAQMTAGAACLEKGDAQGALTRLNACLGVGEGVLSNRSLALFLRAKVYMELEQSGKARADLTTLLEEGGLDAKTEQTARDTLNIIAKRETAR